MCKIFHKILNDTIGMNHYKISSLIDNLKVLTKNKLDELVESIVANKYKINK